MAKRFSKKREMNPAEKEAFIRQRKQQVTNWRAAKAYAEAHPDEVEKLIGAAMFANGIQISPANFMFVYRQMQQQHLKGVPYVDARTFNGWREAGRTVKRGDKAMLWSVTWIGGEPKESPDGETENTRLWPKVTSLFHLSQTEELEQEVAA